MDSQQNNPMGQEYYVFQFIEHIFSTERDYGIKRPLLLMPDPLQEGKYDITSSFIRIRKWAYIIIKILFTYTLWYFYTVYITTGV